MKSWLIALAAAFALLTSTTAQACMPPPPPPPEQGESDESYAARVAAWQAERIAEDVQFRHNNEVRLWDEADSVFLARITRVQPNATDYGARVTLRGIRALKGRAYTGRFTLSATLPPPCSTAPAFDATAGAIGDVFVIFVRGGRPSQRTVQATATPSAITDDRVRALLSAG